MSQTIVKFLIRRGADSDRTAMTATASAFLAEGELAYTTDSKRLFIGDGTQIGGNPVASKFYVVSDFTDTGTLKFVQVNDLVYNRATTSLYALTGRTVNNFPDNLNSVAYLPLT